MDAPTNKGKKRKRESAPSDAIKKKKVTTTAATTAATTPPKGKAKKKPQKKKAASSNTTPTKKKAAATKKKKGGKKKAATSTSSSSSSSSSSKDSKESTPAQDSPADDDSGGATALVVGQEEGRQRDITRLKEGKLIGALRGSQCDRYEAYRRSGFKRPSVKKLMNTVSNQTGGVTANMTIVMAGIAKIFVGEVVETARTVMDELGESGPLRPRHLREAYRILMMNGKIPTLDAKSLFNRR
eukprot:TRINITY_DN2498_c1_g1_i1.p1 TRINITY_DN2498_c1_g1~~TRINITY_DN2498_c1_g1_i1.p1  ORF type:complete len:241 (-),score=112.88 TRINITY_DN2498_c1_g1_i1:833-1555(-)